MSSYLTIYLEKKKKEGEKEGERLLLCSISRSNTLYDLFYDYNIYSNTIEDKDGRSIHEFTSSNISSAINSIDELITNTLIDIKEVKDSIPLVSNKDVVNELLEQLSSDKKYFQELMNEKFMLEALCNVFDDVSESYSGFSKLYWKID